jgi:hypothetical protein
MNLSITTFDPLLSVIFGVLILAFPNLLNYLIALYLIINGILGLGLIVVR